jgi:uncharacterized heparinase superfamily protein
MTIRDNSSVLAQASKEAMRRYARRLNRASPAWLSAAGKTPERLILAPQDLRTPDTAAAKDIYSGRFFLAEKMVDCTGLNPFRQIDAPKSWQIELHGFGWLRHLEAEGSALTKSNAQALINDWLAIQTRSRNTLAWEPEIVAKRLISWLCHSVPVVETATPRFYQAWLKSIGQHISFLKYRSSEFPKGMPRLTARIALAYAANCVSGQSANLKNAQNMLDEELSIQILEDGGHISRNAALAVDILALLLPLRQSYARLDIAPSQTLISTIDRMISAIKFHQMGDGNLARFNGVSAGRPELISTILFYNDSMGKPPEIARFSGFQRLAMGDTLLIADTGAPPAPEYSQHASAGTLSFELSSGPNLVMINCGTGASKDSKLAPFARLTAAHTTATINESSSSRFYQSGRFFNLLKDRIIAGPKKVECTREDGADHKQFSASHDGYRRNHGIIHSRTITMRNTGSHIEGTDSFTAYGDKQLNGKKPARFDIRFHLHPSISAGKTADGKSILMMGGSGLIWKLTCIDCTPEIDESIFFASSSGPKRTKQIVLTGDARSTPSIRWLLVKENKLH